jgi:hypothetical protein
LSARVCVVVFMVVEALLLLAAARWLLIGLRDAVAMENPAVPTLGLPEPREARSSDDTAPATS